MKKILVAAMVFCCVLISVTAYAQTDFPKTIKVGLYYASSALTSVTFEADSFDYGYYESEFVKEGSLENTSVSFSVTNEILYSDSEFNFDLSQKDFAIYPKSGFIKVNGAPYRGGVILKLQSDGKLTVINVLSIDDYVCGVVGREMSPSWHIEALKAQSVCSRCYAASNINKHNEYGFNVCTTTHCQVYAGVSKESESVIKAVQETAGEFLMYDGHIAETLFFSSSGGYTADVRNVWNSDVEYLHGVPDPYDEIAPKHSWTVNFSLSELKTALENSGISVGDVISLDTLTDETGRVYELKITGTEGEKTLTKLSTNSPFYQYGVLTNKFTVTPYGNSTTLYLRSAMESASLVPKYALDSSGTVTTLSDVKYILSSNGKTMFSQSSPRGFVFNGGGWGHGVGMSQYGAYGMAKDGYTYDEILYHYYPGTALER